MSAPTTRLFKAECLSCGYIIRTTRKWLDGEGAPLCPCNGERMTDCREWEEGLHEAAAVRPLMDRYVLIQKIRGCADCGRIHERRALMHYSVASVRGKLRAGWFCVDCTQDYEFDPIPWAPPGTRISETMGSYSERPA